MPVDGGLFREIFARLPTPVAVVTTVDWTGAPRGLTTNAISAVSMDPPLLLVCVDQSSRTLPALVAHRAFVVNFLAGHGIEVSRAFASRAEDKFAGLRYLPATAADGAPVLLDHVTAHAECVVHDVVEAGDHVIFLGRLEGGAVHHGSPLMYFRRGYQVWPSGTGQTPDGHTVQAVEAVTRTGPGSAVAATAPSSAATTMIQ
jgi:flavin reductase (DIM6/NTAB) family NADH-FMN oxidoreductase RutF